MEKGSVSVGSTLFPSVLPVTGQESNKVFRESVISNVIISNSTELNFALVHIYLILLKYLRYVFPKIMQIYCCYGLFQENNVRCSSDSLTDTPDCFLVRIVD